MGELRAGSEWVAPSLPGFRLRCDGEESDYPDLLALTVVDRRHRARGPLLGERVLFRTGAVERGEIVPAPALEDTDREERG